MITSLKKLKASLSKNLKALARDASEQTLSSVLALGVISVSSAVLAGSATALTSVVALRVIQFKNESAYYPIVKTAILAAAGGGAVLGLAYGFKANGDPKQHTGNSPSQQTKGGGSQDWRNFTVVRKVKESEEITSFYLKPEDGSQIPRFKAGQYLTIKLDIPGQAKPVVRPYSLSDYSEPRDYYRLSIKLEPAPEGLKDVPPGLSSNFMHSQVLEGSTIPIKLPSGKFVLDVHKNIPVVLISNGVGITPMISMVKACGLHNPSRPVWFLHGTRNGQYHVFRDEVSKLAEQNPNLKVHFAYSRPRSEDEGQFQSAGHVNVEMIQSLVNQDSEFFLCGSPPFLKEIREGLQGWGVPEDKIFFESFMKASTVPSNSTSSAEVEGEMTEISFTQSGKMLTWEAQYNSILEFAEANELNPDYSCRQGICGTCVCKILEGEVEYQEEPTAEIPEGSVLTCISKPKTARVSLEL